MEPHKRRRSSSQSSTSSSSSTTPSSPSQKAFRSSSPPSSKYTCTLPPSCHETPSFFSSLDSLEDHHRSYHAFICRAPPPIAELAVDKGKGKGKGRAAEGEEAVCGRVFPDERILQLHFTECHDSLAQLRSERGEKIFACFLPSCPHLSTTPKGRRLHLVDKHDFPSQYFFGVTMWGVQEVLKKGGGMVRRDWKPREGQPGWREGESRGTSPPSPELPQLKRLPRTSPPPPKPPQPSDIDDLTLALAGTSISLVPRSVRLAGQKKGKMVVDPST